MEQKIFQDIPLDERESALEANSDFTEEQDVKKYFGEDEVTEMRRVYTKNAVELRKKMEEFKKIKMEIDNFCKPINDENNYLLNNIRTGYVEVKQQVYAMKDHKAGMLCYYDNRGELISSRKMMPHERQAGIKQNNESVN